MTDANSAKIAKYTDQLREGTENLKRALKRLHAVDAPLISYLSADSLRHAQKHAAEPSLAKYVKRLERKIRNLIRAEENKTVGDRGEEGSSESGNAASSQELVHELVQEPVPPQDHQKPILQVTSLKLDESMFKPRRKQGKVFSGRRKATNVDSLVKCSQDVLAKHIDKLGNLGLVPYEVIQPVLAYASPGKLHEIIDMNPLLAVEADELFEKLVRSEFPKVADCKKKDGVSWKSLHKKMNEKKKIKQLAKLEHVVSRISGVQNKDQNKRKTLLTDAVHFKGAIKNQNLAANRSTKMVMISSARKTVNTEGRVKVSAIIPREINNNTLNRKRTTKTTAPLMAKCKREMKYFK